MNSVISRTPLHTNAHIHAHSNAAKIDCRDSGPGEHVIP